jgi:Zn-dependent protease with chaperone function
MTENSTGAPERVTFPGISPRAYEHPVDKGALAALRAVPGFPQVLKAVAGFFRERGLRLSALSSSIRVGPEQYPEIDRLREECAQALDLSRAPSLYVWRDPPAKAMTIGIDEPFIALSTGLVDLVDPEGLRFVIGHEMGHVLSGHAVYRTMLLYILNLQASMAWNPLSALGLRAVLAALREWYRKSELSCDRAGLLCGQDAAAALRVHIQLAGGLDPEKVNIPAFLRQAEEYEGVTDIRDSIHKLMSIEEMTHPFPVVRASQLQKWAGSAEYRAILAGDYPRRADDEPQASWTDDMKAAAKSYRESWSESTDPLVKVFSDVGAAVSDVAGRVRDRWGSRQAPDEGEGGGGGEDAPRP